MADSRGRRPPAVSRKLGASRENACFRGKAQRLAGAARIDRDLVSYAPGSRGDHDYAPETPLGVEPITPRLLPWRQYAHIEAREPMPGGTEADTRVFSFQGAP
jgi:hypothetical protein